MAFYETPRRNASDSTTASNRSINRGHRREHSDPCPLPSPGLPQEDDDAEEPRMCKAEKHQCFRR